MNVELTNMTLIVDTANNKVLAQYRTKDWAGYSLPGGHVEPGESLVDSAVREVKEETGLEIRNLQSRGVVHWTNTKTHDRYLAFLYETADFNGELLTDGREGKNVWMTFNELMNIPSDNGTPEILRMFQPPGYNEAFGSWSDTDPWRINEYK